MQEQALELLRQEIRNLDDDLEALFMYMNSNLDRESREKHPELPSAKALAELVQKVNEGYEKGKLDFLLYIDILGKIPDDNIVAVCGVREDDFDKLVIPKKIPATTSKPKKESDFYIIAKDSAEQLLAASPDNPEIIPFVRELQALKKQATMVDLRAAILNHAEFIFGSISFGTHAQPKDKRAVIKARIAIRNCNLIEFMNDADKEFMARFIEKRPKIKRHVSQERNQPSSRMPHHVETTPEKSTKSKGMTSAVLPAIPPYKASPFVHQPYLDAIDGKLNGLIDPVWKAVLKEVVMKCAASKSLQGFDAPNMVHLQIALSKMVKGLNANPAMKQKDFLELLMDCVEEKSTARVLFKVFSHSQEICAEVVARKLESQLPNVLPRHTSGAKK